LAQIDLSDPTDLNELKLVLGNFFNYLRKRHKEKFVNCLGSFIKLILEVPQDRSLDISKLQDIFSDLGAGDLAAVILSNLKGIKEFDSLNFELFSQLIRREDHEKVAVSLAKQLEREEWIKDHPEVMEKVKNLFSLPKDSYISEVYRRNLSSILSSISLAEGDSFDQEHLQRNYRLMLIDLLIFESEPKRLIGVMNKIFTELSDCLKKNNKDYVDKFIDVFKDKRAKAAGLESFFQELDERVSTFIEDAIFSKELNFDFSRLVSIIQSTSYGYQFYLDKIFKEPVPNKYAFKIFFKFFQREISHFCHQARVLNQQLKLAKEVIAHIKELESSLALELFKRIFSFSNDFVKLEILEAMQNLSYCDEGFLFPILKEKKVILRKKAFVVLAKHSQVRERLAEELLSLTNPFGIRTRLIRRNLDLVSTAPFLEAKKYLLELVQYKLFWNRTIRRQANIILGQYGR